MEIGQLIYTVLGSLVSNKVYPGVAPANSVGPYIVYAGFRNPGITLQGDANAHNWRMQIDAYAATYGAAAALAGQVRAAMAIDAAYSSPPLFSARPIAEEYFGVDPDVQLHRVMLEFSMWYYP